MASRLAHKNDDVILPYGFGTDQVFVGGIAHINDLGSASFLRPGEVFCIQTEGMHGTFYFNHGYGRDEIEWVASILEPFLLFLQMVALL